MPVRLNSSGGGSVTLDVPSTASAFNLTLPAASGNLGINLGTAQNSTSGTFIDFPNIPAGVRRVSVILSGVSTNGSSLVQIQVGAGSFTTSGYLGSADNQAVSGGAAAAFTTGLGLERVTAANYNREGIATFVSLGSNAWVGTYIGSTDGVTTVCFSSTRVTLAGVLDRVRITTVNGTDTFDAGSINVAWEF